MERNDSPTLEMALLAYVLASAAVILKVDTGWAVALGVLVICLCEQISSGRGFQG